MSLLISYGTTLVAIAFLYLFACVNARGTGFLARSKVFFWYTLPYYLKAVAMRICGAGFVRLVERLLHYICYEPNPLV